MTKKNHLTIHNYIYQGSEETSPKLAVSLEENPEHIKNTNILSHKKIKIKNQEVIAMLLDQKVDQHKKIQYLQYKILQTIQRTKQSKTMNFYYKDCMDLIYDMNIQNQVNDLIIQPLYKHFKQHTPTLPPDPTIKAKIEKRKAKRNKKRK